MKVTIELDSIMIDAIAKRVAVDNAYDRLSDPDIDGDLTEMYAVAFADGMNYVLNIINEDKK